MWEIAAAVLAGVVVAAIGTPAGVSGAVFLLPVQISVLGVMGPAVSATNLLFNIISTPIALFRLARRITWDWRGLRLVVAAGAPAAIVGATSRVTVLADPHRFRLLIALILLPLGARLLWRATRRLPASTSRQASGTDTRIGTVVLFPLIAVAAAIGGVLGIGGGSLLAPALVSVWRLPARYAAVLAMATTLTTSVTGLAAYTILDAVNIGTAPAAPYWLTGVALGVGGVLGALVGAGLQRYLSDRFLIIILGGVATVTGLSYLLRG